MSDQNSERYRHVPDELIDQLRTQIDRLDSANNDRMHVYGHFKEAIRDGDWERAHRLLRNIERRDALAFGRLHIAMIKIESLMHVKRRLPLTDSDAEAAVKYVSDLLSQARVMDSEQEES